MTKLTVTVREDDEEHFECLVDGGHQYLCCSNCDAALVDVWVTNPEEKSSWKMKAKCPFCNDYSYPKEVKGRFHLGGTVRVVDEDSELCSASTTVDNFEFIEGCFEINVLKATPKSKPVFIRGKK